MRAETLIQIAQPSDGLARRGADAASGSLLLLAIRLVLQLGQRQPVLAPRVGSAVREDAALDLALGLRRVRRARVDVEAQRLREAAVRGVDLAPGAGAARDGGLLVVDPHHPGAGTPRCGTPARRAGPCASTSYAPRGAEEDRDATSRGGGVCGGPDFTDHGAQREH